MIHRSKTPQIPMVWLLVTAHCQTASPQGLIKKYKHNTYMLSWSSCPGGAVPGLVHSPGRSKCQVVLVKLSWWCSTWSGSFSWSQQVPSCPGQVVLVKLSWWCSTWSGSFSWSQQVPSCPGQGEIRVVSIEEVKKRDGRTY